LLLLQLLPPPSPTLFPYTTLFRSMNDRIQLSFATAPATVNQNGSFRFFDARPSATGYSVANTLLGLFDDYTEFGNKPDTPWMAIDRKSTRLNSSHDQISYAVFCLK